MAQEGRVCLFGECPRTDIEGRGLCKHHYMFARRNGILDLYPKGGNSRQAIPEGVELREIPGLEGYSITSDGRIYSFKSGKWLKTEFNEGYSKVNISSGGNRINAKVSHLVLVTYVGPRPPGSYGLHKDNNPINNLYTNLYWGTHEDNVEDSARNNRHLRSGVRKFSKGEVFTIRKRHSEGETKALLAREYSVDPGTIRNIVLKRTYGNIT